VRLVLAGDPVGYYTARDDTHRIVYLGTDGHVWELHFQRTSDSGHPDQTPKAAVNLGNLLLEQGDVAGARVAYRQAIDKGHPDQAPLLSRHFDNSVSGDLLHCLKAWRRTHVRH